MGYKKICDLTKDEYILICSHHLHCVNKDKKKSCPLYCANKDYMCLDKYAYGNKNKKVYVPKKAGKYAV